MKVIEIQEKFGIDSLKIAEREEPTPSHGNIVVKVKATSLNYRDLLTVQGLYNPKQKLPLIPLSDGVGEVVAIGEGVSRVKVGDRVAGIFAQKWVSGNPTKAKMVTTLGGPLDGMLAEYALLHEDGVVHVPEHLTDEEAATLPCAAVTAWSALVTYGQLKAGETVLVQGTGGVSIFALQFAKLMGAKVIVTSSSDEKLQKAKELGADELINYHSTPSWEKRVREITGGEGVDHIVEVGGAGTFDRSLKSIKFAGQISVIGILSGLATEVNLIPILMQNVRIQGIIVGSRETFEDMNRAVSVNKLKPVIDKVFSFGETKEAFNYMASAGHFGKIVIKL
ncbi:MAG: NAD(P)-dependent alcohol dehydrogenase [Blastocatellia bacterium]|nr:NAD(P)-dependent alcohol dehydrogenase [Blastocatellia bacterium]